MSAAAESIYNLIPAKVAVAKKAPLYRSKHSPQTVPTATSFGYGTATINGEANRGGEVSVPAKHVSAAATLGGTAGGRAGGAGRQRKALRGTAALPDPKKFTYSDRRKPALEKTSELAKSPRQEAKARKDFVRENKKAAPAAAVAKRRPGKTELDYTKKEDYGKAPAYLETVKRAVEEERELVRRMVEGEHANEEAQREGPRVRLMEDSERTELLEHLKAKWNEVNHGYQKMTHLVTLDTLSKIKKKENFESQLAELEKAMKKLQRQHVFVASDK